MKTNRLNTLLELLVVICALTMLACAATAQTVPTNAAPQLTAAQLQNLDGALQTVFPLLPAKVQGYLLAALTIIGVLGTIGRLVHGTLFGDVLAWLLPKFTHGLVLGTNTPDPANITKGATQLSETASKLGLLVALGLCAVFFTGCKSPTQVINFSKGTGLNLNLPLGYNGANIAEINLKIGQFYSATAVQPVNTNAVYVPAIAFASASDGAVTAPQIGATNFASVTGGDKFTGSIGSGTGSISNLVGATSSSGK